jgi:hypothetical protein
VKRLNGWDAMLLYSETPTVHKHTLKIGIIDVAGFDGEFTFEFFRTEFQRRLHLLEPLRLELVDTPMKLHHPMWLETSDIDLDYHLRRVRVRAPGGRRELDELVGEIAGTPLDRGRPLWEMYFVEGMEEHRFGQDDGSKAHRGRTRRRRRGFAVERGAAPSRLARSRPTARQAADVGARNRGRHQAGPLARQGAA